MLSERAGKNPLVIMKYYKLNDAER